MNLIVAMQHPIPTSVVVPTGPRPRPRVSFKSILADIRSGMSDAEIMERFGLSHRGLLSLISKLLWDGLITQEDLAKRKSLARTIFHACCSDVGCARKSSSRKSLNAPVAAAP